MSNIIYRVGIVDDDTTKITQLITFLRLCCCDEYGNSINPKYAKYSFEPISVNIESTDDNMIDSLLNHHLDAVIIDYKLASQKSISYSGVTLAKALAEKLYNFPIFVLTSYQDDLFTRELFDSYLVFDFYRYVNDDAERLELNSKIIEQIIKYRTEKEDWKRELLNLISQAGSSVEIDERILELDSRLEKSVDGKSSLSEKLKRELTSDRVQLLIDRIDRIIESE